SLEGENASDSTRSLQYLVGPVSRPIVDRNRLDPGVGVPIEVPLDDVDFVPHRHHSDELHRAALYGAWRILNAVASVLVRPSPSRACVHAWSRCVSGQRGRLSTGLARDLRAALARRSPCW